MLLTNKTFTTLVLAGAVCMGAAVAFAQEGSHVGRKGEVGGYSQCGISQCDPIALAQDARVKAELGLGPHVLHHRYSCSKGSGRRCVVRTPGA
jgi:hypothetical protein